MAGAEHLSELEKDAIKWYQILQQCEGDARSLQINVIPALQAIGVQKPSLIIESVKALSSTRFIGSTNVQPARISAIGIKNIAASVPEIATYLKQNSVDYLNELLEQRRKINDQVWELYCTEVTSLLTLLGQHDVSKSSTPHEVFFPPHTEYDIHAALRRIVTSAKTHLIVIDPYGDSSLVALIENCPTGVNIQVLGRDGHKGANSLVLEAQKYKTQYGHIEVRFESPISFHDRFIVVDNDQVFCLGSSVNHAGNKATAINEYQSEEEKKKMISTFQSVWSTSAVKV